MDTPVPPETNAQAATQGGVMPEKYIRTFSGDINIFQKGGVPGLAPFKEPEQTPAERLVAASPVAPEAKLAPVTVPQKAEVSLPQPAPVPLEERPSPLKTYSEDFRERMKETHASTATILAAEQDAAPFPTPEAAPEQERHTGQNVAYVFAGMLLLAAGSVGAYYAYTRYQASLAPVSMVAGVATPIFVDSSETVSGTGAALLLAVNQAIQKPLDINTVRFISYSPASSTDTLFSALVPTAPQVLVRNIETTGSMLGVVRTKNEQSPFLILSVSSYGMTFSGMLSWEASMPESLKELFPLLTATSTLSATSTLFATTTAQKTVATTTKKTLVATTSPASAPARALVPAGFRDEVVNNHDVRVYRDTTGKSIFLYGYWDQATLVIARDAEAFAEILTRLATSRSR
jgi:hypothetical protein